MTLMSALAAVVTAVAAIVAAMTTLPAMMAAVVIVMAVMTAMLIPMMVPRVTAVMVLMAVVVAMVTRMSMVPRTSTVMGTVGPVHPVDPDRQRDAGAAAERAGEAGHGIEFGRVGIDPIAPPSIGVAACSVKGDRQSQNRDRRSAIHKEPSRRAHGFLRTVRVTDSDILEF